MFLQHETIAAAAALDWCLFLDVDGTLVELTDTPSQTDADPEIKIAAARGRGALGRRRRAGERPKHRHSRCAVCAVEIAGGGTARRRAAQGRRHRCRARASSIRSSIARARRSRLWSTAHPGTLLEDKDRTIAVHFRMAPQFEAGRARIGRRHRKTARQQLSHPGRQDDVRNQAARIQQGHRHSRRS